MIEVNLLPGAARRPARRKSGGRGLSLPLPKLGKMPQLDRMTAFIVGAWVIAPLAFAWMFLGARSQQAELAESIEVATQDSTRYAQIIAANAALTARRDTIAQKLSIIQQIDAGRYVWPHILDELSRALPEYTWLTAVTQTSGGPQPELQISGQTGNNLALTRYMTDLEASPFITGVRLASTNLMGGETAGQVLYEFILEARYQEPPADAIQTVPLLMGEE